MRDMSKILPPAALLLLATSLPLCGQSAAPVLHKPAARAPEIAILFTVRNKKGDLVENVDSTDFALTEDGQAQKITAVAKAASMPLRLGLLEDTGRSMSGNLEEERSAAGKFLDQFLTAPPAEAKDPAKANKLDQAFLLHFDSEVELLEDFTAQLQKLHRELDSMEGSRESGRGGAQGGRRNGSQEDDWEHSDDQADARNPDMSERGDEQSGSGRSGRGGPGGPMGGMQRTTKQLFDAVYLASDELMKSQSGRKALVVISDGADSGSKVSMSEAIDAAQHAGVLVYTIYLKGEQARTNGGAPGGGGMGGGRGGIGGVGLPGGWPGGGGGGRGGKGGGNESSAIDGKKVMEKLATRTGGHYFEAKKKDKLDEIYTAIAGDLRALHAVTYTPDMIDKEGGFHKILIKSPHHEDWIITASEGYYAPAVK